MIKRFRGDTYPMRWQLLINDKPADLSNIDTVTFAYKCDGDVYKIQGIVIEPTSGKVQFNISESDFTTVGSFEYDIQVVYKDGTKRTFEKNIISIIDDINKD